MKKRVRFSSENQKRFIQYIKEKSDLSWKELSNLIGINESTLSKSYRFALCDIPYDIFKKMIRMINENEGNLLKKFIGKIRKEELVIGRKVIGEQKKILYPIKITFKNKNVKLNNSIVNYSNFDINKGIKLPNKLTPELAEEIGMQFGDGFLSAKRYDYRLKGNPKDEKEYYLKYIKPLFKKLYNINLKIKDFGDSFGFEVSSKALWEFKTKVIGITPGRKNNISIPKILKINNIRILTALIRGLFDTDGSLSFKTKYGYEKYYPEIRISLISKKLINEIGKILQMLGFNPNIYLNGRYGRISINGIAALKKYEKLIGWSSQKNLNKVNAWRNRYPQLDKNMADVVQRSVRTTVARDTWVRLPASAFQESNNPGELI